MDNYIKIIKEICDENNISFSLLSKDWVMLLEKDNIQKYICGYKFPVNNHAVGEIVDDKYALYCLLNHNNLPVVPYHIVYNFSNKNKYCAGCNNMEYVKSLFFKYDNHIVIKTNKGSCGSDVYEISNEDEIIPLLEKLFIKYPSVSICPFINIKNEYRIIVFNNQVKLVYQKIRPILIGDGVSSVKDLLLKFNKNYFESFDLSSYDFVLEKDKTFMYSWKHNLSNGAICDYIYDEKKKNELSELALCVAKRIGLCFGSIDIIETFDNQKMVLEINSGVMMDNFINIMKDGKKRAKSIYSDVIDSMF